jgi:DNA-binding MarR family transcriptional regulator
MTEALIDLLSEVSHLFQQRLRDGVQAANVDLTAFEARTLVTIARMPGSTQQVVAARMGCDKAQLARAVKVLESRSLIARKASADDWRASDLLLTQRGDVIFADLQARRAAIARVCLANVSSNEREKLFQILASMIENLS